MPYSHMYVVSYISTYSKYLLFVILKPNVCTVGVASCRYSVYVNIDSVAYLPRYRYQHY